MTVHNLVAAAHLNGRQGTVLRYNNKRKRWAVKVDGEEAPVMILAEKLKMQTADPAPASEAASPKVIEVADEKVTETAGEAAALKAAAEEVAAKAALEAEAAQKAAAAQAADEAAAAQKALAEEAAALQAAAEEVAAKAAIEEAAQKALETAAAMKALAEEPPDATPAKEATSLPMVQTTPAVHPAVEWLLRAFKMEACCIAATAEEAPAITQTSPGSVMAA